MFLDCFIKPHSHPNGFYWGHQCSWTLTLAKSMKVSIMQSDDRNRIVWNLKFNSSSKAGLTTWSATLIHNQHILQSANHEEWCSFKKHETKLYSSYLFHFGRHLNEQLSFKLGLQATAQVRAIAGSDTVSNERLTFNQLRCRQEVRFKGKFKWKCKNINAN